MAETEVLLVERRGPIGVVTFNRPERRNALSPDLLVRLHEVLEAWAAAGEVRVVVVTGAGDRSFSAGFDVTAIPTDPTPEMARLLRDRHPLELGLEAVQRFPWPTIAMLNGHCFGAALNLALCCDLRLAADDVAVGMPPAKLGLVYPADGVAQFVRVLGTARARQVFFTGRTYRGAEVQAMCLVDRLVPRAELASATFALAEEIAGNAPLALRGLKRILHLVESAAPLGADARREADALMLAALQSEDAQEGQLAFLEKRPPRFTGR